MRIATRVWLSSFPARPRRCFLVADHQLRHAHVWVGKLPEAQTTRRLGQPWRDVDFALARSGFQLLKVGKVTPGQFDLERLGQPFHQLDVGPGQPLQARSYCA
jgi:hypothetical protein